MIWCGWAPVPWALVTVGSACFPRETLGTLWAGPDPDFEPDDTAAAILEGLATRGASFFREIYEMAGGGEPDTVLDSLWDLVWAGHVTNDTFGAVRAQVGRRASSIRSTLHPLQPVP